MKLLLFDIDGTLVNLHGAGWKALDRAFMDVFGFGCIDFDLDLNGKTDPVIQESIMIAGGREIRELNEQREKLSERYIFHLENFVEQSEKNPVIPFVREFLELSRNNSEYISGLLTGNLEKGAYIKIRKWKLDKYFSFGAFGSDSAVRGALVPIAVDRAVKIYNRQFSMREVYVIGDTPLDIKCAKDNNAISVAVATGNYKYEELLAYMPDICLRNLSEWKI